MKRTKKLFNDITFFSGSAFISNIINFATGIIIRRILQPALMGLFNEIMLVFDYARYSHFGIIDSLDRELPYLYGKKDHERVQTLKNAAFTFCLAVGSLIGVGVFIASFIIDFNDKMLVGGIRIVSLIVIVYMLSSLYIVSNRAQHRFSLISKYTILTAACDLLLKTFLTIKFGLWGLLWASFLTFGIGLLYFYKMSRESFRILINFPFKELLHLFKIGFPMFIMGFAYMTLRSVDRIMIIRFLGRESLGFYTISLMLAVYIVQLPNLVYAVIFPRFYQAYGERQNIHELRDIFVKPTFVFAYFFPVLIGAIIIALPLLIEYLLKAYSPGLTPAYILLLGSSFLSLINMPGYLLIAINKQYKMISICVLGVAAGVILNYIFAKKFNMGLTGIAIGTSITYFLYSTALMIYAFKHYTKNIAAHLKFFSQLYAPFLWVLALLAALNFMNFNMSGRIVKDLFSVFFREVVFLLSCLPLFWYVNRKTSILSLLKQHVFRIKQKGLA